MKKYYRVKLLLLTTHYVFPDNVNVFVSVRSGMFMPKSHYMTQFVNDNPKFVAILSDANSLSSISSFSNKGTTSNKKN